MPRRLHRNYSCGYLHYIASSCYQRRPLLGLARRRNLFLAILEQVRCRYGFVVVGYVLMPEHIHLLISEPDRGNPSTVMQVLKQRFAHRVLQAWRNRTRPTEGQFLAEAMEEGHVWQRRFYDSLKASAWRNYATCIAILWNAVWCGRRNSGTGAAIDGPQIKFFVAATASEALQWMGMR